MRCARSSPTALRHAVLTSCAMKAAVVAADEREDGRRGRCSISATPSAMRSKPRPGLATPLLHGEAVALGHGAGLRFRRCGSGLSPRARASACAAISRRPGCRRELADLGLAAIAADALLAHMGKDKKVRDGQITLILPRRIGDAFVMKDAPAGQLRDFLAEAD